MAATSGRVGRERVSREVGRDHRPQGTDVFEAVLFRDTRDVNSELEEGMGMKGRRKECALCRAVNETLFGPSISSDYNIFI